ncbi:hypothetical protein ACLB2K_044951 [Fragaria x ananassa]
MKMEKAFTLVQTVAVATVFSAVRLHVWKRICSQRARKLNRRPSPPESQFRSTTAATSFLTLLGGLLRTQLMASGGQCGIPSFVSARGNIIFRPHWITPLAIFGCFQVL